MNDTKQVAMFDGKLFKVMNYIYWIFMSSTFLLITNLLLIFVLYVLVMTRNEIPFTFYHMIIVGVLAIIGAPSVSAIFSVMNKIIQSGEVSIIKDLIVSYRNHFLQSISVTAILMFFCIGAVINYTILEQSETLGFLILPLMVVLSMVLCIGLYTFPLISLQKFKVKEIFKLALYFSIKEFTRTIVMLVMLTVCLYAMISIPSVTIFLLPGIYCLVSAFLLQGVYKKIV